MWAFLLTDLHFLLLPFICFQKGTEFLFIYLLDSLTAGYLLQWMLWTSKGGNAVASTSFLALIIWSSWEQILLVGFKLRATDAARSIWALFSISSKCTRMEIFHFLKGMLRSSKCPQGAIFANAWLTVKSVTFSSAIETGANSNIYLSVCSLCSFCSFPHSILLSDGPALLAFQKQGDVTVIL